MFIKEAVKKIIIHPLSNASDRRGDMVTVEINEGNRKVYQHVVLEAFYAFAMVILDQNLVRELQEYGKSTMSEHFHANWIKDHMQVRVRHKYWGQRQVDAFNDMIIALAKYHNWDLEDQRSKEI